jgi:AcrR family transcriptional regulator
LETALKLFIKQAFEKTPTANIAKAANVGQARYFITSQQKKS